LVLGTSGKVAFKALAAAITLDDVGWPAIAPDEATWAATLGSTVQML
jgi:hypothetical protein